jgi:hypothetical protein
MSSGYLTLKKISDLRNIPLRDARMKKKGKTPQPILPLAHYASKFDEILNQKLRIRKDYDMSGDEVVDCVSKEDLIDFIIPNKDNFIETSVAERMIDVLFYLSYKSTTWVDSDIQGELNFTSVKKLSGEKLSKANGYRQAINEVAETTTSLIFCLSDIVGDINDDLNSTKFRFANFLDENLKKTDDKDDAEYIKFTGTFYATFASSILKRSESFMSAGATNSLLSFMNQVSKGKVKNKKYLFNKSYHAVDDDNLEKKLSILSDLKYIFKFLGPTYNEEGEIIEEKYKIEDFKREKLSFFTF